MAKKLTQLEAKREQCLNTLLRYETFLNSLSSDEIQPDQLFEIQSRQDQLSAIFSQFEKVQSDIELNTQDREEENSIRSKFENTYFSISGKFRKMISMIKERGVAADNFKEKSNVVAPLPTINLPSFDGDYGRWVEFRDFFVAVVDSNKSLSNIQKFLHLRSSLRENALATIRSIPVTNENYKLAWQQLIDRYERSNLIINHHINLILDFPPLHRESGTDLRKLFHCIRNNLESLRSLGCPVEHWDLLLIRVLSSKLDKHTIEEWERFTITNPKATLHNFLTIISNRCELLEKREAQKQNFSQPSRTRSPIQGSNKVSKNFHLTTNLSQCRVCEGAHPIFKCEVFLKLNVHKRISKIKQMGLCLNCLKPSHYASDCTSSRCKKCNKAQNTLLHMEPLDEGVKPTTPGSNSVSVVNTQSNCRQSSLNQVILPTAVVLVEDVNHKLHKCRALLDTGAMSNFITTNLCRKLGLPTTKSDCSVSGVGQFIQRTNYMTDLVIQTNLIPGLKIEASCLVIDKITSNIPMFSFEKDNLKIPKSIKLADPNFHERGQIDLLLGSSVFWKLLQGDCKYIPQTGLTLQKTKLGWIVGGPLQEHFYRNKPKTTETMVNCTEVTDIGNELREQLTRFWEIEDTGDELPPLLPDEKYCEEHFVKTHKRDSNGRFIVKIPFKTNVTELGESRQAAIRRFSSLERRLAKNEALKGDYIKFMREYESMGHMREVKVDSNSEEACYYIPHHAIIRESSSTSKLRVVFDASAKTSTGLSLNDTQHVGPTIQNDIFSILVNFRLHRYVMSADISKMYRMAWIHDDHKPYHKIFWRENSTEPLKCFELQTVTYGTASAPYLAMRCLKQVAIENEVKYPLAAKTIKQNFYVDDLLCGSDDGEELIKLQYDLVTILSKAGFDLRKWQCNNQQLSDQFKINSQMEHSILQLGKEDCSKVLGIAWDPRSDVIIYLTSDDNNNKINSPITKRAILSELAQIFDPLGLLGPIIVKGKILMQNLWQEKTSWDDLVPPDISQQWLSFREDISRRRQLVIHRHLLITDRLTTELHGFADASEVAYGAAIYLKSTDCRGNIKTGLLCAKSRVAPLKKTTLPRLELCAAELLSRLVKRIVTTTSVSPDDIHYWSDSTVTLAWIRGDPGRWKTFVANRVSKIQGLTKVHNWHHVVSKDNPADVLSRGTTIQKLLDNQLWWEGPSWLREPSLTFHCDDEPLELTDIPEQKTVTLTTTLDISDGLWERYSSFLKVVRIAAYILRFQRNSKPKAEREVGQLTVHEIHTSTKTLIRLMQLQCFPREHQTLTEGRPLSRESRLLALNPFLDENNLIRVGGRLSKGDLKFDTKHLIVLAPKHKLTKLIVKHLHFENCHCGPTTLLSIIRQQYWPLDSRNLVKGIIRNCKVCFLASPTTARYIMGQLPKERISECFPFENAGVDYAGPILLRDRKTRNYKTIKAYICLFICLATKAIHLECVTELTTEGFLDCLRRFISRRGKPRHIFSDNGRNFVGANAEIQRIYNFIKSNENQVTKFCVNQCISWHFIPAQTPHFGGIWEAGIKRAKYHLARTIKRSVWDFEELSTILCQIEGILNSRPLTPLTSDPTDLTPLTPSHFLIGRALTESPEINPPLVLAASRLKRYHQLQGFLRQFWDRWSKEYIVQLQPRRKWKEFNQEDQDAAMVGRLVLVKDVNHPPLQWPLGRITEVHPGADGVIRVVTVKTQNSIIKRSLRNICFLPEEKD